MMQLSLKESSLRRRGLPDDARDFGIGISRSVDYFHNETGTCDVWWKVADAAG